MEFRDEILLRRRQNPKNLIDRLGFCLPGHCSSTSSRPNAHWAGATALNHMDPSKEPGSTVWGQDIYHDEGWLHKRVIKAGTGALPPPGALVHVKCVPPSILLSLG